MTPQPKPIHWREKFEIHKRGARCDKHDQDGTLILSQTCPNCMAVKEAYKWSQAFITTRMKAMIDKIPGSGSIVYKNGEGTYTHEELMFFKQQLSDEFL